MRLNIPPFKLCTSLSFNLRVSVFATVCMLICFCFVETMADSIFKNLLVVLLLFQEDFEQRRAANGSSALPPKTAPSQNNGSSPSTLHPEDSLRPSMLLPASPINPVVPSESTPQPALGITTCVPFVKTL